MTEQGISLQNVGKSMSNRKILTDVSFSLQPGTIVALLGHNGAGKTTLFRLILGYLKPDEGTISVMDEEAGSTANRKRTSFLPESFNFPRSLTGEEVLKYYMSLKGETHRKSDELLERVGLSESGKRRVSTYSKGMLQRLGIAQVLIGNPKLVLLDEPTSGLDPFARQNLYELISGMADKGATVLQSSHALTELEVRTDRLILLKEGKVVADDTLSALRKKSRLPNKLKVETKPGMAVQIAGQFGVQTDSNRFFEVEAGPDQLPGLLAKISGIGDSIEDFEYSPPGLNDVYMHYSRPEFERPNQ